MLMFLWVATSLTEQSIRNRDSFMFKFKLCACRYKTICQVSKIFFEIWYKELLIMTYTILYFYWKKKALKAFKICPLVNLVEKKFGLILNIWFGTLLPLNACSGNSKGLSDIDFLQCLEHQQNKKVEKMLQLLSTHNRFVNVKLCLIFEASNIQKKDPSHAEIKVLPWAFQQKLKEL